VPPSYRAVWPTPASRDRLLGSVFGVGGANQRRRNAQNRGRVLRDKRHKLGVIGREPGGFSVLTVLHHRAQLLPG